MPAASAASRLSTMICGSRHGPSGSANERTAAHSDNAYREAAEDS